MLGQRHRRWASFKPARVHVSGVYRAWVTVPIERRVNAESTVKSKSIQIWWRWWCSKVKPRMVRKAGKLAYSLWQVVKWGWPLKSHGFIDAGAYRYPFIWQISALQKIISPPTLLVPITPRLLHQYDWTETTRIIMAVANHAYDHLHVAAATRTQRRRSVHMLLKYLQRCILMNNKSRICGHCCLCLDFTLWWTVQTKREACNYCTWCVNPANMSSSPNSALMLSLCRKRRVTIYPCILGKRLLFSVEQWVNIA